MKYIVEIKPEYEDSFKGLMFLGAKDSNLYVDALAVEDIEELNSDYINEHFGELQDTAYQRGLEDGKKAFDLLDAERGSEYRRGLDDAWKAARKIVLSPDEGGTSLPTLFAIFGRGSMQDVFRNNSASEAISKLKAYEKQKAVDEIKVGDEVYLKDEDINGSKGLISRIDNETCTVIWVKDGSAGLWYADKFVKTGRHFDIDKILGEMKE